MKNYLLLCSLLFFSSSLLAKPKLEFVKGFGENHGWLKMFVYTPKNVKKNAPLLVGLHGCAQTASSYAHESGWFKLADEHGFILLLPQTQTFNNISMCYNWFTPVDINRKKQGESRSIKNMIEYMKENRDIDTNQIFITGVSAGAAMSVVMMSLYPETFKAGSSLAGGPYKAANNVFGAGFALLGWVVRKPHKWAKHVIKQNPNYKGSYPKMVIAHGRRDPVSNRGNSRELAEQWSSLHKIDAQPTKKEINFQGHQDVNRLLYQDKDGNDIIIRYDIRKIGHRVPIDPGKKKNKGGRKGLFSKDINFHSTYWIALDMGLIKKEEEGILQD